jgi:hypothetical protein
MGMTDLPDFLRSSGAPAPAVATTAFSRVQFTVRGMMLAVAAIAFLLGGVQSGRWFLAARDYRARAAIYSRRAIFFAAEERRERSLAETRQAAQQKYEDEWNRKFPLPPPGFRISYFGGQADRDARVAEHYFRMKAKYERAAAANPWLPVEPDPIPPY